ncbi:hypothetical protein C8035_v006806 [Colletotrichum spinosum]|uniref:DUF7730 domain-containing protein n=1 Tax=Colletotrichum spinosum TaxID=1347390 RepID=A0A4R8QP31_9PEZI|nr:hypothetical protein C8035_v006806 [Colletotrichum spinosum]
MKDEQSRRLGVRSLTRKTVCFVRRLTGKRRRLKDGGGGSGNVKAAAGVRPKFLGDSESSVLLLPSPGARSIIPFDAAHWRGQVHDDDDDEGTPPPASTAPVHDQLQTGFFALPEELREMVYRELWRASGFGQHVFRTRAGLAHSRCLLHRRGNAAAAGGGEEEPWESMWMAPDARGGRPLWMMREISSWCDHWKCEEAREERLIWKDIARGCSCIKVDTWTAFLPMMRVCKRMYHECVASIYKSLTFTVTDVALACSLFSRRRGSASHPFRRVNLSFRRQPGESRTFEQWVDAWSKVLRMLDTPDLVAVNLWLETDVFYERRWLSVSKNVFRRVPEAMAHKLAVSLPPGGDGDRDAAPRWLRGLDEVSAGGACRSGDVVRSGPGAEGRAGFA